MRHELITVAGLAPQIVTETVWWLARQAAEPVTVTRVHIVTTMSTSDHIRQSLCEAGSAFARLEQDWHIPAPATELYVFDGPDGSPLFDIRTSAESAAFASGLAELVRRLTMDPDLALHASIAGGRKTMGFHLGHVMSLFGRPQDRLSHVLVPPAYENCDDFWYPEPKSRSIVGTNGAILDAAAGSVELTEIEHVKLRGKLSARELARLVTNISPLFRSAQTAIDDSGHIAQTEFGIDAVLAGDMSLTVETTRPLVPVMATLRPGSCLALRLSVRPAETPALRMWLGVSARGSGAEDARAALRATCDDVLHTLDLNRTGYRLSHESANSDRIRDPLWTARIVPSGPLLRARITGHLIEVGRSVSAAGMRVGHPHDPRHRPELPVRSLLQAGINLDLLWTIERISLAPEELETVNAMRSMIARGVRTAEGDLRLDTGFVLQRRDEEAALGALSRWSQYPDGFRMNLSMAAETALPDALVATVGRSVWGRRPFDVRNGQVFSQQDAGVLDLSDSMTAEIPPPFELPPIESLRAAGMPQVWPEAHRSASLSGAVLGRSERLSIRVGSEDRARHLYVIGATGTGKSTLLRNLILQDLVAGEGVFALDPHGDLVSDILDNIPDRRADDVILLDAGDVDYPFGINILEIDPERRDLSGSFAISELLAIFWRLYKDIPESMGPAFEQYFTIVLKLLMDNVLWPEPNLLDVARVLSDHRFRNYLRRGSSHPAVNDVLRAALQAGGEASWENFAPYITNKLNRLTLNPLFRNIFCQVRSTVDFRQAMDNGKIILVRLPKGALPERDVQLLGMLIVGKLFAAALARSEIQSRNRRRMYVYIDEFQNFVTGTVGQMMAEARKYGLAMTLANQNLAQLEPALRETVLGNVSSLLAFRSGPADAAVLESFFEPALNRYDLQALPNHHCAARILSGGAPVAPQFVFSTEAPQPIEGEHASADGLIAASRLRYGRPRSEVEAEITARFSLYADCDEKSKD